MKEIVPVKTFLTSEQFENLSDVPPEIEWLPNITNEKTRRAYKIDVGEFSEFMDIKRAVELRTITRAHVIRWRKDLEARELSPSSIRRKLSGLFSLFDYLCERNAVASNPVDGVKRPMVNGNEGSTRALGDAQARKLLGAPPPDTLKGLRDRAILATLLYHGMRREELCLLSVRDIQTREGVKHFRIKGKRNKIRFVPIHAIAAAPGRGIFAESRPRQWQRRSPLPAREEQPHARAAPGAGSEFGLQEHSAQIWPGDGHQRRGEWPVCPLTARHGGDERPLP